MNKSTGYFSFTMILVIVLIFIVLLCIKSFFSRFCL